MTKKSLLSMAAAGIFAFAGIATAATLSSSAPAASVYADTEITVLTNPKSGSTVTKFPASITIMFDGATSLVFSEVGSYTATWNGVDYSPKVRQIADSNNSVTFDFNYRNAELDDIEGDGTLVFTLPEGYYIINGSISSPAVNYTLTVDEAYSVEGTPFFDLWTDGFPQINGFVDQGESLSWIAMELSEEVTLNKDCTETIDLILNGSPKALASIPATDVENAPANVVISGKNVEFFFSKTEEYTENGTYTVTVPNGFFLDASGNPIAQSSATFQIGAGTFYPANGATVDLLGGDSKLVNNKQQWYLIRFTPFTGVEKNDDCTVPATLTNEAGEIVASFLASACNLQKGELLFRFANPVTTNGKYTLTVPAGFFTADMSGKLVDTPSMTLEVNLIGGSESPKQDFTISPDPGTYFKFPTVTLTYADAYDVVVPAGTTVTMDVTSKKNVLTFDVTAEENVVTLTPQNPDYSEYFGDTTVYTITIPANTYSIVYESGTFPNILVEIKDYNINPLPEMTITPADGSTMEEFTTLVIEPHSAISYINSIGNSRVYKMVDGTRGTQIGLFSSPKVDDKTSPDCKITSNFKVSGSNVVTDGEYEVEIPASLYKIKPEGAANPISSLKTIIHYIIGVDTAVKVFETEKVNVTVYNANGIRVIDNQEPSSLTTLPAGLYIVNGKKVIIR